MAFSLKDKTSKLGFRRLGGDNVIFTGVLVLAALLLALILWDGYVFYRTVLVPREQEKIAAPNVFTKSELDEVINILDEREKKFNDLLGVTKAKK